MGTKLTELRNGCFYNAMDDEPMFVLLARDPSAPFKVEDWANTREAEIKRGRRPASDMAQVNEARETAQRMRVWREANDGKWRTGLFTTVPALGTLPINTVRPPVDRESLAASDPANLTQAQADEAVDRYLHPTPGNYDVMVDWANRHQGPGGTLTDEPTIVACEHHHTSQTKTGDGRDVTFCHDCGTNVYIGPMPEEPE